MSCFSRFMHMSQQHRYGEGSFLPLVKWTADPLKPKWAFLILHAVMRDRSSKAATSETPKTAEHHDRTFNKYTEL